MKTPVVFSLVREQSVFMTAIMSLLTFLAVLAFGSVLAIGGGVIRWNAQWDLMATVQAMPSQDAAAVQKILDANADKIESVRRVSDDEMSELMRPWISGGGNLKNYMPTMWELRVHKKSDMAEIAKKIDGNARFLTHATAMHGATTSGWRMIAIAGIIFVMAMSAIVACISYIARNTAQLHHRELEILNQVGARDAFIARQMQIIVGKISLTASAIGFCAAAPILLLIISAARSARVGLMATMGLSAGAWVALLILTAGICIFSIWTARRTTLKILQKNN